MRRGTPRSRWLLADDGIVDTIAVDIAARGERRVALTWRERLAAAELVLSRGGTAADVAERLHISGDTARTLTAMLRLPFDDEPVYSPALPDDGPAAADLAEIEAEIAALDAETVCRRHSGGATSLDWRRQRRAQNHLLSAAARAADLDDLPELAS